jgi:hypothetical protein
MGLKKNVPKKIGRKVHNFQVEGENLFDVMMQEQQLSFPDVDACGLCGKDDLKLGAHLAKNKFKYVTIKCNDCWASLNFGQQTENPNVYYLRFKEGQDGKALKVDGKIQYDWMKYDKEKK